MIPAFVIFVIKPKKNYHLHYQIASSSENYPRSKVVCIKIVLVPILISHYEQFLSNNACDGFKQQIFHASNIEMSWDGFLKKWVHPFPEAWSLSSMLALVEANINFWFNQPIFLLKIYGVYGFELELWN